MVEISLSGSGEGSGWVTAPGYSTAGFWLNVQRSLLEHPRKVLIHNPAILWVESTTET